MEPLAKSLVEHGVIQIGSVGRGFGLVADQTLAWVRRLRGVCFRFASHCRVAFYRRELILGNCLKV